MKNLMDLMSKGQVIAPCVWDCMSANQALVGGCEAVVLSESAVSKWVCGLPNIGLMTADDLVRAVGYISSDTDILCIVEASDGYGETPVHCYRTCERLIKAGADAIIIDDSTDYRGKFKTDGSIRINGRMKYPTVSRRTWLAKLKAAMQAGRDLNPSCMIIARTDAIFELGLDEAIERCALAEELGIRATSILGLRSYDDALKVSSRIKGFKMYEKLASRDGVSEVGFEAMDSLGYKVVSMHSLEKAAICGMIDFGRHAFNEKTLVYHDTHTMGYKKEEVEQGVIGMIPKEFTAKLDRYMSKEPDFWKDLPDENSLGGR